MEKIERLNTKWFILAHCFNMDGRAASQTITDRIPFLMKKGIDPLVLSAPTGIKDTRFPHFQIISPAPSGIRFEMRFIIKNKFKGPIIRNILKSVSAVLCAPFYWAEKLIIQLDSQWSWFLSASIKGYFLVKKYNPALLYSTAGPPSTHLTGYILHKIFNLPWIAEMHDPLILDDQPRKWHDYYFKKWIEKKVCKNASAVIYFTEKALENANRRHPIKHRGIIVRPGANPPDFSAAQYKKRDKIHFAHFGSLDKTRNLNVFIQALHELIKKNNDLKSMVLLDIYGCELDAFSRKTLSKYPLDGILMEHGRLEYDPKSGKSGRQQVMEAMRKSDVLVILHGGEGSVCNEYIPSKLYEYLLTYRPILGLAAKNTELEEFLIATGNLAVDKDNVCAVKKGISEYIDKWEKEGLSDRKESSPFTVEATVNKLLSIVKDLEHKNKR